MLRWRAWVPVVAAVVAAVVCGLLPAAPARAGTGDPCAPAALAEARVGTGLEFRHDDRTHTKIETVLTVDVPARWQHAEALLLSPDSRAYVNAMACLARQEPGWQNPRWSEWRPGPPEVTTEGDRVKVVYKARSWVNKYRSPIEVGIWQVWAGADLWTVTLQPPPALAHAFWDKVTVDPGPPGIESALAGPFWDNAPAEPGPPGIRPAAAAPMTVEATGRRVWRPVETMPRSSPALTVSIRPSWQRAWAAQYDRWGAAWLDMTGGLLWTLLMSGLLLRAAVLYRRRGSLPPARLLPLARQRRVLHNLERWAVTAVALHVLIHADGLIRRYDERDVNWSLDDALLRGHVFALAAAALLLAFAKPPRAIWVAGALLMLPPLATMTLTQDFGLCASCAGQWQPSHLALVAQATASCCLMAVTVLGFVAVAWRLALDAELLPKSRRPVPPGARPLDRRLRLRVAGPAVLVWTLAVALSYALTEERNWQRATWLSDRWDDRYGPLHLEDFLWETVWSASNGQEWVLYYTWLLTTVAVLAVLRTWRASEPSPLDDRADRLLFLAFFPLAVAISGGRLGNALPEVLWIAVNALLLFVAVTSLSRHAVLEQRFEVSRRRLAEVAGPGARAALLNKSRIYRETHAELRRLDQGMTGDPPPERARLERKLDALHEWPTRSRRVRPDRLPAHVSVVDAALALGPKDTWWGNGVRGARFALVPGVPAAVLGVWSESFRGEAWQDTLMDLFGLPGMVLGVLWWVTSWVGAGFVLGALWRVLPGRRGAVKALPVAFAFALSVALDALLGWFTQEGAANLALYAATMLLVLTVTGIALDLDTFRSERRYWQSRLGLLLSVYQMRYYSLQVAYLVAQVIAVISIWKFFAEPSAGPPDADK